MTSSEWLHKPEAREIKEGPEPQGLEPMVIAALRTVFDPEMPVNIYDLGLIYTLEVDGATGNVQIEMTLTAPHCPVAQSFPGTVQSAVKAVGGVCDVHVELVWDPPWSRQRMSEAARLDMGMF
jgi:FeS assembly SUF system protein